MGLREDIVVMYQCLIPDGDGISFVQEMSLLVGEFRSDGES